MTYQDNLTTERPTFVSYLECGATGERYAADQLHNLSSAGKPLLVRYDLDGVGRALDRDALSGRAPDFWRYRELLPVRRVENIVSLGEAMTPLLHLPGLGPQLARHRRQGDERGHDLAQVDHILRLGDREELSVAPEALGAGRQCVLGDRPAQRG